MGWGDNVLSFTTKKLISNIKFLKNMNQLTNKPRVASVSNIEWTDTTWNPTTGCDKVSAGCKNW